MEAFAKKNSPETNRKFKARQATEKRILEAATEVFTQRGFAAATIAEMVERSSLSRGAFYVHFPNKRSVFFALVSRAVADLYELRPTQPGEPWRERIRESTRAYLQAFERHRGIMKCLFETSTSDPKIGALHNEYRATFADRLAQQISEGIASGRLRDIDARAASYCFGSLISGVAYRWLCADFEAWPHDPMTVDRLVDTITDIWCRTVFPDEAQGDASRGDPPADSLAAARPVPRPVARTTPGAVRPTRKRA